MIYYLVLREHAAGMHQFLATWGGGLAERVTIMFYERVLAGKPVRLPAGTYIFASLGDIVSRPDVREDAGRLYRALADTFGARRVLNDPLSFLGRYDLLAALHARGMNRFAAHRPGEIGVPPRFPVFLRHEFGSEWSAPPLLRTPGDYRAAIDARSDLAHTIAIEYCDTADATGLYRKYACFVVGERIVPRHLFFSRNWFVKQADLAEPWMLEEELAFLEANPHAAILLEVCRIAGLSYGRIDYGLLDGRVQIWEINHTPMIASALSAEIPGRAAAHRRFLEMLADALDAIDPDGA